MRMGVLDVGANAASLVVAEVDDGVPSAVRTVKYPLRLAERLGRGGRLGPDAVSRVAGAGSAARAEAARWGCPEPFVFATAVVRDAPNAPEVLAEVRRRTGVLPHTMPGEVEAELTYLAVRRWMGWQVGPLAVLDIGGGSFEVAFGRGGLPDFATSLPLGARVLTREYLDDGDPPSARAGKELRRHVRRHLEDVGARIRNEAPHTVVATSRTFQQLARLCGAPPGRQGWSVPRRLARVDLARATRRLAALPAARRAELPGISAARAKQALAGSIVAHAAMRAMDIDTVTLCPWAVREGILLRHIEDGPVGAGSRGRTRREV
ncbi:Ppx/GppA phosphatase family protein [Streptomyces specialis]|uniref:Ppx/GppA phosphatase family protein n=1 Tax=Streptomyces specialis TaxID=498367 RepID=UPI00073E6337|nr:hypothetical protein [Streptomyces specialis]